MKKIEAIVRKSRFEAVKQALHGIDIHFFTYWDVVGIGKEKEDFVMRGAVVEANSIERVMLSIVVRDHNVEKTVDAIIKAGQTGKIGDGKIFISHVDEVIRIRTGERGPEALYLKGEEE
ncbi:MAG: P-II family nitrogen regulator [Bacteroidales bacterium]